MWGSLRVEVSGDEIIVTQRGSKFRIVYCKSGDQPQLVVKGTPASGLTRSPSVPTRKKTTAALSEPPLPPNLNLAHMPLVHFLAVASHCMPAFLQAASVFGAPANAGAVKATTRLKARIETNAFIDRLLRFRNTRSKSAQDGTT